jgi:hypothetical protein
MIFLINTREEMDMVWGKKTEPWFVGATKNRNIYIFNENVFSNVSNHKQEDFWITLKHEYSHIYYLQLSNTNSPLWLHEGLACYLSGKQVSYDNIENDKLFEVFKYFKNVNSETYRIGQYWVEKLLSVYGKDKMVALISGLSANISEPNFAIIFQKIYGIEYSEKSFKDLLER